MAKGQDKPKKGNSNKPKLTTKENVYGFHGNKKAQFLMIELVLPKFISVTKRRPRFDRPALPGS